MPRPFDPIVLGKVFGASFLSGTYYLLNGPFVSFNHKVYGPQALFTWFSPLPSGINGFEPSISEDLQKLIDETTKDLVLSDAGMRNVKFKTATIPACTYAGSGRYHTAYAALPDYMNISSISALRATSLNAYMQSAFSWKVENPDLWMTGVGKLLVDSFVLSEKAKKFAIAKQAYMADNGDCIIFAPVFFFLTFVFYFSTDAFLKRSRAGGLSPTSPFVQFVVILSSGLLVFGNFILLRNMNSLKMEKHADAKAISKGKYDADEYEKAMNSGHSLDVDPDYYEGAMEFYSKEIQRHQSLRLLIKQKSWYEASQFTEDGDYRLSLLRYISRPSQNIHNIVEWKLGRRGLNTNRL